MTGFYFDLIQTLELCAKFAQCDLQKYQNDVVSPV